MAFLLACNGKMCAVWMGYNKTCAEISRGPLPPATRPPQPIYSQSPHFGQSVPATSRPSKADVRRNRSLVWAHAPISARQVLSANFQYKGVIFHLKNKRILFKKYAFLTLSQEARWHLMFWKEKRLPAVTDPLSFYWTTSFILLNNYWHTTSSVLKTWWQEHKRPQCSIVKLNIINNIENKQFFYLLIELMWSWTNN